MIATPGITGLLGRVVVMSGPVYHLDVELSFPGGEASPKGWTVRPLKAYMIWVQTVVMQVSFYLLTLLYLDIPRVRK